MEKERQTWIQNQTDLVQILTASVKRCVTMGKLLNPLTSVSREYHLCYKNVYKD